ncbi:hypothetical protein C7974DRAFT_292767, partial [Boeremia exigua]|uniref:uncharacterized protein n=1 Tax=Boeremia exigua TaxID=749465 RepID=UPI001E8E1966
KSESTATSSLDRKRKATEPELTVTTIDPFYDLTLIIGAPGSSHGQAAFRVNKGTLRHASEIWTKMLTGAWAESKQSEIEFPDDSPWAFELVLRVAHLQMDALPAVLDLAQMEELARLTDKYNLGKLVEVALASKQWLNNARSAWQKWPAEPSYQDWAVINHVFRSQDDYEYLVTRLAVEVQVDEKYISYYYGSGETKTELKSDLPDRIQG